MAMSPDILLVVSSGTIIFLVVAGLVTFFFCLYQKRFNAHLKEKEELKNSFQHEILKAQLEMQEQTFLNISQEIHDNIGQILSLIRLNISTIQPHNYQTTGLKVSTSKELLDKAIDDLRNLSKRLNAEFVQQQSLAESLRFQLNLIQKAALYNTSFELHGAEISLPAEIKLIIFRIVQEALNNIIKHAEAKTIQVVLTYAPEAIYLIIQDDGLGFADNPDDTDSPSEEITTITPRIPIKGIGIYNMHYRARLIGAHFKLESQAGVGTQAQLILPLIA